MSAKRGVAVAAFTVGILVFAGSGTAQQDGRGQHESGPILITSPVSQNAQTSHNPLKNPKEKPLGRPHGAAQSGNFADPAVQTYTSTPAAAQSLGQWEGLGIGLAGFVPTAVPPDPNMAVGPNHIVQWVNNALVTFDKHGNVLQGPIPDETFWGSYLGTCDQLGGMSDPIVKYDRAADRWIVAEVAIPVISQFVQCFAVSKTSDPTFTSDANGLNTSYYTWAYGFGTKVNDYDKISVWPDGYYVNWNIFDASSGNYLHPEACAWNRTDMLTGVAAPRFVCFNLSNNYASLLAFDWDGSTAPPAGSPNYEMEVDTAANVLEEWQFHVDYTTPANSTFTGPTIVSGTAPFSTPCPAPGNPGNCIPQPGTTQNLDSVSDRLMYRLAYRNFGDHESIVANHTVSAGANAGVRWYEVRNPAGTPTVYQQGTLPPTAITAGWQASLWTRAATSVSDIVSRAHPPIRQSLHRPGGRRSAGNVRGRNSTHRRWRQPNRGQSLGRLLGNANRSERRLYFLVHAGIRGGQSVYRLEYPCWFVQVFFLRSVSDSYDNFAGFLFEPVQVWTIRHVHRDRVVGIGNPDGRGNVHDGATALGTVALSGGQAQLPVSTLSAGTHSITPTYLHHQHLCCVNADRECHHGRDATTLASSPNPSLSGQSVTFTATIAPSTATGTVTFYDNGTSIGHAALSGGTAKLSISNLSVGTHPITASYGGDSKDSSSTSSIVNQKVTGFTISAPSPQTVHHGSNVSFPVTVTPLNGFSGSVSLSVIGLPSRSNASFSPKSATGPSWTSTLTISTGGRTPTGTSTLTIRGTSGSLSKTTTVQLTVN